MLIDEKINILNDAISAGITNRIRTQIIGRVEKITKQGDGKKDILHDSSGKSVSIDSKKQMLIYHRILSSPVSVSKDRGNLKRYSISYSIRLYCFSKVDYALEYLIRKFESLGYEYTITNISSDKEEALADDYTDLKTAIEDDFFFIEYTIQYNSKKCPDLGCNFNI